VRQHCMQSLKMRTEGFKMLMRLLPVEEGFALAIRCASNAWFPSGLAVEALWRLAVSPPLSFVLFTSNGS